MCLPQLFEVRPPQKIESWAMLHAHGDEWLSFARLTRLQTRERRRYRSRIGRRDASAASKSIVLSASRPHDVGGYRALSASSWACLSRIRRLQKLIPSRRPS